MKSMQGVQHRRTFLRQIAGGAAALWALPGFPVFAKAGESPVCLFSKHLQWLGFDEMAETTRRLGFDGLDLTVRPGGHVAPESVETDLPRAVAAAQSAGISIPTMTTAITDPSDPLTERILASAARQGVRYYRLGYYRYSDSVPVEETLSAARRQLEGLARLNEKHGICGDYQNHAGRNYLGSALWDLREVTRDLDPRWIGSQFDLRHAMVEGAYSWPVGFRLLADRIHTVVVKDFAWQVSGAEWEVENRPLGQGVAPFEDLFERLQRIEFEGPITMHFEYRLGGANRGARKLDVEPEVVLRAMRRDLLVLRGELTSTSE